MVKEVATLRVLRFFGEALRQAGILIVSSTLVIWGLVFIIGLECGIEGAYFTYGEGTPAYSGVFAAWCDLRELVPLVFGYMMAAKVGTGIVAELGSMRISDEIDALEVMGISGMRFLCATRLLAALLVLPFVYVCSIGAGFFASYLAVVQQIGYVTSGGFFLIFWQFQNPPDLLFSLIKAMSMAVVIVIVGCYYGYNASRRAGRRRDRDREVDGAEPRLRPSHRHARHPAVLGRQPTRTNRRLNGSFRHRIGQDDQGASSSRSSSTAAGAGSDGGRIGPSTARGRQLGGAPATTRATSAIRTRSTAPRPAGPRSSSRPRSARSRSRAPLPTVARSRRRRPGRRLRSQKERASPPPRSIRGRSARPAARTARARARAAPASRSSTSHRRVPSRPAASRTRSTSGTPTRSIPRAVPTPSSSSTPTRRSAARTSCGG